MDSTHPKPSPPSWADAWGDDRYGLWAELPVKDVRQRMRWVEPGRFLMGSPKYEGGQADNEGPQHEVTLTQGFWLADAACSQALWLAVMGSNPSYLRDDPQKPVERVSWDDVQGAQGFCQTLQTKALLPEDTGAVLPTEAQWEYACRAGSITAYSFGDGISVARANFDHDGKWQERMEAKRTTIPVKALPANDWGFYQMHGNVWEWCVDAMREYTAQPVTDPSGATGKEIASRALRGGSWIGYARNTRSAQRNQLERDLHLNFIGFRFALKSRSQQGAGGRPASLRPEGSNGV